MSSKEGAGLEAGTQEPGNDPPVYVDIESMCVCVSVRGEKNIKGTEKRERILLFFLHVHLHLMINTHAQKTKRSGEPVGSGLVIDKFSRSHGG